MVLKFKNYLFVPADVGGTHVPSLQEFLQNEPMEGKKSRLRNRFLKLLNDRLTEIDQTRNALLDKYAYRDEKGEKVYLDKDGKETSNGATATRVKLNDETLAQFNAEYLEYMNEELIIESTLQNTEEILTMGDVILNTSQPLSGPLSLRHNEWCDVFEGSLPKEEQVPTGA